MSTIASASSSFTSFTGARSPRYPAPDVARGFMLLLIALANVPFWAILWGWEDAAEPTAIDTAWEWVRGALVDQRSYPLFAMLFGFGLVVMARRRIEHDVEATLEANRAFHDSLPEQQREAFVAAVREAATVDARKMVRRRGLWMLLFGAVHSLFFSGDIIGAYGLIAVLFAGTFVRRRTVIMWVASVIIILVGAAMMASGAWFMDSGGAEDISAPAGASGVDASGARDTGFTNLIRSPWYPLVGLVSWIVGTPMTVLISISLPAAFLGAWVAGTDLLTHPERRRRTLVVVGAVGLAVAALTSIPLLALTHGVKLPTWVTIVSQPASTIIGGIAGACGWLALLALFAGGARADDEPLTGVRRLLAAVGKRSMTAYLLQTVCFGLIYGTLAIAGAKGPGTTVMALSAVLVWLGIAWVCTRLERAGRRGPFERLLRRAVARSARRSRLSQLVIPPAPTAPGDEPSAAPGAGAPLRPDAPTQDSQPRPM